MKIVKYIIAVAALLSVVAIAATKGDPSPFAKYGVSIVRGYDGGLGAPICLGIPNQNSLMVRNWQGDGGTSATLYCGFDTSVSGATGMPLQNTETLTVDLVSLAQGTQVSPTDGGVNTVAPKLCCIGGPGSAPVDLRWMIVK